VRCIAGSRGLSAVFRLPSAVWHLSVVCHVSAVCRLLSAVWHILSALSRW
jgi:hypothetical protein